MDLGVCNSSSAIAYVLKMEFPIFVFSLFSLKLGIFLDFKNKIFHGTCMQTLFFNMSCIVTVQPEEKQSLILELFLHLGFFLQGNTLLCVTIEIPIFSKC